MLQKNGIHSDQGSCTLDQRNNGYFYGDGKTRMPLFQQQQRMSREKLPVPSVNKIDRVATRAWKNKKVLKLPARKNKASVGKL